ncbi:MAG: hypothetical protein IPN11_00785 [Opitutaceae bacterium]|nr:hypothetical protein [Opitutaceae bacterium]
MLAGVLTTAAAADSALAGRWRLDTARSSALDGWNAADLVIARDGTKVALTYHMTWRATKVAATNTVDTAQTLAIKDYFRIEQRHMAVYPRPGETAQVSAAWLDAGRTLRVEALVPVEISQGNTAMRIYQEFRLLEDGATLLLIELHNTRHRPLVYHFTKVPAEAAAK